MPTVDTVIRWNKKITNLIKEITEDSSPNGLNEATNLIEDEIPDHIVKKLRFLATIRNRRMHDEGFEDKDIPEGYDNVAEEVWRFLNQYYYSTETTPKDVKNNSSDNDELSLRYHTEKQLAKLSNIVLVVFILSLIGLFLWANYFYELLDFSLWLVIGYVIIPFACGKCYQVVTRVQRSYERTTIRIKLQQKGIADCPGCGFRFYSSRSRGSNLCHKCQTVF